MRGSGHKSVERAESKPLHSSGTGTHSALSTVGTGQPASAPQRRAPPARVPPRNRSSRTAPRPPPPAPARPHPARHDTTTVAPQQSIFFKGPGGQQAPAPARQPRHAPASLRAHAWVPGTRFDPRETIFVRSKRVKFDPRVGAGEPNEESSAEDVIDLGAPRLPSPRLPSPRRAPPPRRVVAVYTPNPRLYPGPAQKRRRPRGEERPPRRRRPKRVPRRAVPNSRLYQPAPPRPRAPLSPAAAPRVSWPAPAPPRALDTASRAALRLAERRAQLPPPLPPPARRARRHQPPAASRVASIRRFYDIAAAAERERRSASPGAPRRRRDSPEPAHAPARRLVVTLPEGRMTSSASNEPTDMADVSAPSEYLAEFLSAIMRQQYAEALKYCRLILQYEPHNATARGFHPLLQQKLRLQRLHSGEADTADTADTARAEGALPDLDADPEPCAPHSPYSPQGQEMEQEADVSAASSLYSLGSDGDDSDRSLSLLSRSDRTDRTDRTDCTDPMRSSSGSPPTAGSGAMADLNGNCAALAPPPRADDVKNDNAPGAGDHIYFNLTSESSASLSSLRRLRARFACSK